MWSRVRRILVALSEQADVGADRVAESECHLRSSRTIWPVGSAPCTCLVRTLTPRTGNTVFAGYECSHGIPVPPVLHSSVQLFDLQPWSMSRDAGKTRG